MIGSLILTVFAFCVFAFAASPWGAAQTPRLTAVGLAFWVLAEIVRGGATLLR